MGTTHFNIRRHDTDEIIHTVTTDKSGRQLERIEMGLLSKVDTERFYLEGPVDGPGEQS